MNRFLALLLSLLVVTQPAFSLTVDGELKKALLEKQSSDPSGYEARVYWDTVNKAAKVYDGTSWTSLGSASGSGELNLVTSPSTATNWSKTGSTGLGANSPATTTTSGDLPLGGIVSSAIQMTSGTGTGTEASHYNSFSFTTPATFARKLKVEFYQRPGSNFIASEWTVSVYAGSTRQALSTDVSAVTYLPNFTGKFTTTFDSAASTAYTLRFARTVNAGGNAGVLNIANVIVGPGTQPQGSVVTGALSYTPTYGAGFGTTTHVAAQWFRIGEYMYLTGRFTTGTVSAAAATISIPTGYSISPPSGNNYVVGYAGHAGTNKEFNVQINGSDSLLRFSKQAVTSFTGDDDASTFTNASAVSWSAVIRISEWAGSGTVNVVANDVEYACSTTGTWDAAGAAANTVYGDLGCAISGALTAARNKVIQWQRPVSSADSIGIEFRVASTNVWVKAEESAYPPVTLPSFSAGVRIIASAAADQTTVGFLQYAQGGTTFNSTTGAVDWASSVYDKWRARKSLAAQAVGFGEVAPGTSAGLVSASGLKGATNGAQIAVGYASETIPNNYIASGPTTVTQSPPTTATYYNLGTVTLTAGNWMVYTKCLFSYSSAPTLKDIACGPTTNSAGTGIGADGAPYSAVPFTVTTGLAAGTTFGITGNPTPRFYSVSGSTSVNVLGYSDFTGGTSVVFTGYIYAVRMP